MGCVQYLDAVQIRSSSPHQIKGSDDMHIFIIKVNFSNGAYGIISTPYMKRCDLDNWLYYMGVRKWRIIMMDDNNYECEWYEASIDRDTSGKEVLHLGENFFLNDFAKVWDCKLVK